jgi:transcriptional regulator with XRE-family HTH domain
MSLEPDPARTDDFVKAVSRFIDQASKVQARHLVSLRESAGLTQEQLGRRIGFSRSVVGNAEGGHRKASGDFWHRADEALGAGGALVARHEQMQAAAQQQTEILARLSDAQDEAGLQQWQERARLVKAELSTPADPDEAVPVVHDPIAGAGLRISAAVLDLLSAVQQAQGAALHLSEPALDALHRLQAETGDSPSAVADQGIQLYSHIRDLLASGAEITIREPGAAERPMQL